jgi:hypothetical protein
MARISGMIFCCLLLMCGPLRADDCQDAMDASNAAGLADNQVIIQNMNKTLSLAGGTPQSKCDALRLEAKREEQSFELFRRAVQACRGRVETKCDLHCRTAQLASQKQSADDACKAAELAAREAAEAASKAAKDAENAAKRPPLSDAESYPALFENACTKLGALAYAGTTAAHSSDMPGWFRLCSAHPNASVCEDAIDTIKGFHRDWFTRLKCGSRLDDPVLMTFDGACARLAAVAYGHSEVQHQTESNNWTNTCSAHPEVSVCKDTIDTMVGSQDGNVFALKCGGSGRN